jgi:hypothetical protein
MKHIAAALACALVLGTPAKAQQWEYLYSALLGPADFSNSRGVRLGDLCAVVQQDRANFHRFGRRDQMDSADAYFGSTEARSRIPGMCRLADGYEYIRQDVLRGVPRFVAVLGRFDASGRLVAILVTEGAG